MGESLFRYHLDNGITKKQKQMIIKVLEFNFNKQMMRFKNAK